MSEFVDVIGRQLERSPVHHPLNHYILGESNVVQRALALLYKGLPSRNFRVLDAREHEVEPRDLRFQGNDFFSSLYAQKVDDVENNPERTVQPIVVPDISSCYVDYVPSNQPANHLFLQLPLEGNEVNPSMTMEIAKQRPNLPKVLVLHHLGFVAGQAAYDAGYRDIVVGHFKNGLWHPEDLR